MDSLSTPTPPTHRSLCWWLGQSTLCLLLWLSLIKLPTPPSTDLDPSWQMALGQAALAGLQHGRDIIFTYGPLYFFHPSAYMGGGFGTFMAWQIIGNLLVAAGLYRFGRSLTGWRQAVYYAYFLWFGTTYADAMQMNFIAIFGLMLTQREYRRPAWILAIAGGFAALSLVKFTNLLLCIFIVATLAVYYAAARARTHAALLAGGFGAIFIGGWLACGQSPGNLPAFLYYGMELSTGYVGAMGADESPLTFALGLTAAGSVAAYAALYFFTSTDRLQAAGVVAIIGAVIFLNWKHGFVRADGHVLAHYVMVLLVTCTYPALAQDNRRFDLAKNLVLGLGTAVCLLGIGWFHLPTAIEAPGQWNQRVRDNLRALLDLPALHRKLDSDLRNTAAAAAKPTIRGFVGRETVDHLGSDQGLTVLNQLNYTPRPAIQSYTTYTEALNRLDEAFYRSDRAPRFVVQRYQSIDGRLIALDDSLTLKLLFQNYDYALEEGGLILWERPQKIRVPLPSEEPVVLRQTVRFNEPVTVPDGDQPLWAEVRIRQNLAGQIRQFLYKPPALTISLEDDQGATHDLRFIRSMGATGFILQPFFKDSDALIAYQNGQPPRKIRRFTLRTMSGGAAYFARDIDIELRALAPFTRAVEGLKVTAPHRFRMMNRPPQRVVSPNTATDAFIDGQHLLQMHPTSLLEFALDEPVTSVRAAFGIMPGAYAGREGTLGVEFIVEWQGADGRTERLYTRLLDPRNRPEDRPQQTLEVDLGSRRGGKLLLRTEPGPSGNKSYGWSYWTDIEIK